MNRIETDGTVSLDGVLPGRVSGLIPGSSTENVGSAVNEHGVLSNSRLIEGRDTVTSAYPSVQASNRDFTQVTIVT